MPMPLENHTLALLNGEATKRGVSIQELLADVIIPEWFGRRKRNVEGGAGSHYKRTLGDKLASLEEALQDLKVEIERGLFVDQSERFLARPAKLIRSIEDLLNRTFGGIVASSLLYEIGKESGRHSMKSFAKDNSRISHMGNFQLVCNALAPLCGWLRLRTIEVDFEKGMVHARGTGSIYAGERPRRVPTCHFGRGVVAGALEIILGIECESLETSCEGRGDSYCELVTGVSAEITRLTEGWNATPSIRG